MAMPYLLSHQPLREIGESNKTVLLTANTRINVRAMIRYEDRLMFKLAYEPQFNTKIRRYIDPSIGRNIMHKDPIFQPME